MSKKQKLFSRLENLFSNLDPTQAPAPPAPPAPARAASGWSWQVNAEGFFTACSPEACGLLGMPLEEIIGASAYELCLSSSDAFRLRELLHSGVCPAEAVLTFQTPQQSYPVRAHVLARHEEHGKTTGWSGFNQILENIPTADPTPAPTRAKPRRHTGPLSLTSPPAQPWTDAARESAASRAPVSQPAAADNPAVLAAPFRVGERGLGLIEVVDENPRRAWDEDERLLVQEIAQQLGLAMENAELYSEIEAVAAERQRYLQEAQRRALELQTAAEIARDTTQTLSLEALLTQNVNLLCERFGFYHASIFLLDESGENAVVRASTGKAGQELLARNHKLAVGSRSIIGTTTARNEPVVENDVLRSENHYRNPLLPDTRAEMGIPLSLGQRVIGAIDIQSTQVNAFSQDDLTVFRVLSDQIAIAIENARAYELAQKAIEEMQEVDQMKSQFLANMSHELRTPLNSIIGFSRVIIKGIDGPINAVQEQDLNAIYTSGQHLLSLINDILDLSKIEAGKMTLAFDDLHLGDLVNSVMATASGLVKDKPIRLIQDVPDDLPVVQADTTRVRQVLLNFLSNAAKFTDQGSITVTARVQPAPQGGQEICVTVADTGQGIAEEDRHKLFQAFSQVDDSPTRKTGGTGLGLAISRNLILMHQGRIGLLSSDPDSGSSFYFTLPLAAEEPALLGLDGPAGAENTVLAIDDEPQIIQLYTRFLNQQGYQVAALTNPNRAVEAAKRLRPFAITLDIMMPEKNGWQVLQDLKNDPETRDIPVIVCSILEEEERGVTLGAADYLVKPFLQDELIHAINRLNWDGQFREVLVIDDNPADLRLVEKMLSDHGKYRVSLAEGGNAGWEQLQQHRPDILILDLFMPGLNGFALLEKIQQSDALRALPVLVLTGADLSPEQHQQLAEFGQQLLSKSYLRQQELLTYLESALKRIHG